MTGQIAQRLVLGTAQLGLKYGVANLFGRPDESQAAAIIDAAWQGGIREYDTAQAYGDSEAVLGRIFKRLGIDHEVKIISKIDPQVDHSNGTEITAAVELSLERLGVGCLDVLMVHDEGKLAQWEEGLAGAVKGLRKRGIIKAFGASVYTPGAAIRALNLEGFDAIQLPANFLDRRFEQVGVFDLAEQRRKNVYIRSVFLQGLLVMNPSDLPAEMAFARKTVLAFEQMSRNLHIDRRDLALGYIREKFKNAMVLFGAETPGQVMENIESWQRPWPQGLTVGDLESALEEPDERIIDPRLWPERIK